MYPAPPRTPVTTVRFRDVWLDVLVGASRYSFARGYGPADCMRLMVALVRPRGAAWNRYS